VCRCLCNDLSRITLGIYLRVGLLDHIAKLCSVFKKPTYCFPKWLYQHTFPPAVYEGSLFPASSPTLLLLVFLMIAILTGMRWNLSVVLIYISFMARDGGHFVMYFLAIWISSFEKVLFSSVAHFFIGSLIWVEFFGAPYIFWLSVLCLMCSQRIFFPTLWVVSV
jgi:hypothetical protein